MERTDVVLKKKSNSVKLLISRVFLHSSKLKIGRQEREETRDNFLGCKLIRLHRRGVDVECDHKREHASQDSESVQCFQMFRSNIHNPRAVGSAIAIM